MASVEFVDAGGKPIYDIPTPPLPRITGRPEQDAYTVILNARTKRDVDVYFIAAYDIRLDEAPALIGNLLDTLDGINQFIDARVLPTVIALLPPAASS